MTVRNLAGVPRLANALLRRCLPPDDAETISGDLEEMCAGRDASFWYGRQVLSVVSSHLLARVWYDRDPLPRRTIMAALRQDLW
jgi:hypothetical protein